MPDGAIKLEECIYNMGLGNPVINVHACRAQSVSNGGAEQMMPCLGLGVVLKFGKKL